MYWPAGPKKVRAVFNEGPNRVLGVSVKKYFFAGSSFLRGGLMGSFFYRAAEKERGTFIVLVFNFYIDI